MDTFLDLIPVDEKFKISFVIFKSVTKVIYFLPARPVLLVCHKISDMISDVNS